MRLFPSLVASIVCASSFAAQPRLDPDVAIFSSAFPELLQSFRTLLDAAAYCQRIAATCWSAKDAAPAAIADMSYMLDRITTFPTASGSPRRDLQKQLASPKDSGPAIAALRDQYESRLREFDTEFLGHFGAMLHACEQARPSSDKSRLQYEGIRQIAIDRYWMLSSQESQQTIGVVDGIGADTIRALGNVPKERCTVLLALGKKMLAAYWRRLKPYAGADWSEVSYKDRFGESMFFTWTIALELEAHVRPDVLKEIDAFEEISKP